MADDPAGTVWVVVSYQRVPWPYQKVVGTYATQEDATNAAEHLRENPQWFTSYSVERRLK
jgi:hypothetical protein